MTSVLKPQRGWYAVNTRATLPVGAFYSKSLSVKEL